MNSRRSFLRSLGVAVMAVSMDVLPRFAPIPITDEQRLLLSIDGLIAALDGIPWVAELKIHRDPLRPITERFAVWAPGDDDAVYAYAGCAA